MGDGGWVCGCVTEDSMGGWMYMYFPIGDYFGQGEVPSTPCGLLRTYRGLAQGQTSRDTSRMAFVPLRIAEGVY